MSERKYSPAEIDSMRRSVELLYEAKHGTFGSDPKVVEEQLRTYLMQASDPVELSSYAQEKKREAEIAWAEAERLLRG